MKIIFLGTGTSQGIPVVGCSCETCTSQNIHDRRFRTSVYIHADSGHKYLIDTSPDLRQQLLKNRIDDVDFILYTHEHNDHTAGLDDIRPINFKQAKMIKAYGLHRVVENIKQRFSYAFKSSSYQAGPKLEMVQVDKNSLINDEVSVIEINHGDLPILGFRIGSFAYLTDISSIPENEFEKLKNLEIVVISALQRAKHYSHQSLEEALALSNKIKAKFTYLTHMSHTLGCVEHWSNELPQNVHAAYDNLSIVL